jgi:coenzyme F420 hydrogenase subunit beta
LYLLENYLVQGVVVPRRTGVVGREHVIATSRQDVLSAMGSHLALADAPALADECTTYSSIVPALKELEQRQLSCVAVVGTSCQIRMLRKMQCLGVSPSHVVGYALGLFCMGQICLDPPGWSRLEEVLGVGRQEIGGLNVGEELSVLLREGSVRRVPLHVVQELTCPTCSACTEFASDFADLAIGGTGAPDGHSTVLVRTEKGRRLYNTVLGQGGIEEKAPERAAELRSEKTKMLAGVVACARRKRDRGEARLRQVGLDVV